LKKQAWELPKELAEFFQERCQNLLNEKELEEFSKIPVPSIVNVPTKLDPLTRDLLEKKGNNRIFSMDEEIKDFIPDCIKPLDRSEKFGQTFRGIFREKKRKVPNSVIEQRTDNK